MNEFVEMCHQLRVLNSVRECTVGIPITFRQYPYYVCICLVITLQVFACKFVCILAVKVTRLSGYELLDSIPDIIVYQLVYLLTGETSFH